MLQIASLFLRCSDDTLSESLVEHIQRTIALSFRLSRLMSSAVGAQVSLAWSITLRTQELNMWPRILNGIQLLVSIGRSLRKLFHADFPSCSGIVAATSLTNHVPQVTKGLDHFELLVVDDEILQ